MRCMGRHIGTKLCSYEEVGAPSMIYGRERLCWNGLCVKINSIYINTFTKNISKVACAKTNSYYSPKDKACRLICTSCVSLEQVLWKFTDVSLSKLWNTLVSVRRDGGRELKAVFRGCVTLAVENTALVLLTSVTLTREGHYPMLDNIPVCHFLVGWRM